MEQNQIERTMIFCLHDLQDLIASGKIDFYDVVYRLHKAMPNHDKYLELAASSLSAAVAEERYFNAENRK
jgi:hypothetical protein